MLEAKIAVFEVGVETETPMEDDADGEEKAPGAVEDPPAEAMLELMRTTADVVGTIVLEKLARVTAEELAGLAAEELGETPAEEIGPMTAEELEGTLAALLLVDTETTGAVVMLNVVANDAVVEVVVVVDVVVEVPVLDVEAAAAELVGAIELL